MRRLSDGLAAWITAGAVTWAGLAWLGWSLWRQDPPRVAFDLTLLLHGARHVVAGESPYDPALLAGQAPHVAALFFSYPPPVAQAMTVLSGLPDGVVLALWAVGATAGLALIAALIARASGRDGPGVAVRAAAVAPLFLPFSVALLYGNLDAWYPLGYGALVLAVLPGASRRTLVAAGAAVAVVTVAKLHPATLLLWIAARAVAERGGPQARVLAAAAVTGVGVLVASVVIGGTGPWLDYVAVVRAGAGASLVDPLNLAPVSLLGQAVAIDPATLRLVQVAITALAAAASVLAAVRVRDPLASLSIAVVASLVTLPVTWYHYPVALMPVGIALAVAHPDTRPRVVLAVVVAGLSWAVLPLFWLAAAILVLAGFESAARTRNSLTGRTAPP